MITKRQEKLLDFLIKEYISTSEPVSSKALQKVTDLDVSSATIRNDLQDLTKQGYIEQPHTSAGRVPTEKAYQLFANKIATERAKMLHDFILKEIEQTRNQLENEMKSLSEIFSMLEITHTTEETTIFRALKIIGPTREICYDNEDIIKKLIKELGGF